MSTLTLGNRPNNEYEVGRQMIGNDSRKTDSKNPVIESLSTYLDPAETRSPARIVGVVGRGLMHIGCCFEVLRLVKLLPFAESTWKNPRFVFKIFTSDYLALGLPVPERVACFSHHYRRLHTTLPHRLLRQTLHGQVALHEIHMTGHRFSLTMCLSGPFFKEGEFSLNLLVDGEIVFILSFTIVPGWVLKSSAPEALLISRLQGVKAHHTQISLATETLHHVAPPALLLAALQGIACALGIGEIASVCATKHICYAEVSADLCKSAYDDFFAELGIAQNAAGFFLTPVPIQDKPLAAIKKGHKLRTKEKREFKRQITERVSQSILDNLAAGAEPSRAEHPIQIPVAVES